MGVRDAVSPGPHKQIRQVFGMTAATDKSKRRCRLAAWALFCIALAAGVGCIAVFVVVPAAQLPTSRLYASWLGYPAVMRRLGRPIEVEVETVAVRTMVRAVSANGRLRYLNEVPVRSEVLGIVSDVLVEPGQTVKKGDVLLRVNTGGHLTRLAKLQVDLMQAELDHARKDFERQQKLAETESTSSAAFEKIAQGLKRSENALKAAIENYEDTLRSLSRSIVQDAVDGQERDPGNHDVAIYATVSGTIFAQDVRRGDNLVRPQRDLMLIGDRLVFRAALDQRYAAAVQKGSKARIYLRAYPGVSFGGEVVRLGSYVAAEDGRYESDQPPYTFEVWIALDSDSVQQRRLLAGMNGYCVFEQPFSAPAIPESALMRYSGRQGTALVVDASNHLQVRRVGYTMAQDGWVAVETGLAKGDLVVVQGQVALRPGDKVSVKP